MRKTLLFVVLALGGLSTALLYGQGGQPQGDRPMDVYFIDTEGGQATLVVTPTGQSMLIDTGFAGNGGAAPPPGAAPGTPPPPPEPGAAPITRDADRIMAVLKKANIPWLDYVVITHYHGDHVGNAAELAKRIPIRRFVDHGNYTVELAAWPQRGVCFLSTGSGHGKRDCAQARRRPSAHGGCAGAGCLEPGPAHHTADRRSSGSWNDQPALQGRQAESSRCHTREFRVARTGHSFRQFQDAQSGGPVHGTGTTARVSDQPARHVRCVPHDAPRGSARRGAATRARDPRAGGRDEQRREKRRGSQYWDIVHSAPGLEDFWQLHRSAAGGAQHNSPEQFLANLNETDHGHNLKMSVKPDGSFTLTNERSGFSKTYSPPARSTSSAP